MWCSLVFRSHGALCADNLPELCRIAHSRLAALGRRRRGHFRFTNFSYETLLFVFCSSPSTHELSSVYLSSWFFDYPLVKFNITRGHKHWHVLHPVSFQSTHVKSPLVVAQAYSQERSSRLRISPSWPCYCDSNATQRLSGEHLYGVHVRSTKHSRR
jgi:hypothetical protein